MPIPKKFKAKVVPTLSLFELINKLKIYRKKMYVDERQMLNIIAVGSKPLKPEIKVL